VRRGDTVIVGPATFTVRKAEKNVLTIGIANVAATTTPSSEGTVPDGAAPPPAAAPFDAAMAKAHQAAWAKHLGFPVEFTNPVGMVFVLVPPGEYLRGSPDSDPAALANEKPQHRVRIDHALYVSRTEVTQTQFKAVTGSNPPGFYPGGGHGNRVNGVDTSAFPVESVNWLGASAFCETLQKKHPPTLAALGAQSYRLLTEAEWEYACRAGTTSRWSMTDDEAAAIKSVITGLNYKTLPRPVGGLPANAWGLFDMHGNIFEWCADGYSETEYAQLEGKTAVNPVRAPEGATRVARGGSWDTQPVQSRSAYRLSLKATDSGQSTGFRVCITVPVKGPEPAE
jgi:formylglycine-generating enzyme required for sulfatase activity